MKLDDIKVREFKSEYGEKRISIDLDGLLMESYGFRWISMDFDRLLMESYRFW